VNLKLLVHSKLLFITTSSLQIVGAAIAWSGGQIFNGAIYQTPLPAITQVLGRLTHNPLSPV